MVVFAAGNDARGDDALGPLLLARIEGLAMATVRCVFDFQLQVEHALDLDGADMALFVDAHVAQAAPARLSRLRPAARPAACSHALAPDEVLAVSVSDTGIGIAPADQEAVFQEFRQAGGQHLNKSEGTGLGLSLTRRFVEMHGGTISLESTVGEGSTFSFTLPSQVQEHAA